MTKSWTEKRSEILVSIDLRHYIGGIITIASKYGNTVKFLDLMAKKFTKIQYKNNTLIKLILIRCCQMYKLNITLSEQNAKFIQE